MSDYRHVSHVKSRVVIDESPKLPSADSILYGEIAVNYAKDYETISLKNDEDEIVTFSNDNKIFSAINEVWDAIPEIDETISSSSTNPVQNQAIFNVIKDNEEVTANVLNVVRNSCGFDENGLYSGPSGTTTIDDAVTFLYNKLVAQLALNQSLEERITALENKTVSLHLDDNGVLSVNNE